MATVFARFIDTEPDEFKRATEVTYLGAVYGTMAALKRMSARDRGTIVQVGSALAYRAIPLQAAYCGAKFAIRGFTDSIRTELAPRQQQGADHDGAAPRSQHHAVQLVPIEAPRPPDARCRRSISPRSPRRPSTGPPTTAAASCGSATAPCRRSSPPSSRRAFSPTATWRGPASPASRSKTCRSTASGRATCSRPCSTMPPRTASSTSRPRPAAPNCGRRRTGHCVGGAILAASAGVASRRLRELNR